MLDVARVRHKYRGDVFHAAATGLDGSGKESRSIAVARLRGALLRDLKLGDLFGRMRGTFARPGGTRHATTKGIEPNPG